MSCPVPVSFGGLPEAFVASVPDARTDTGARHISITARRIQIERQVAGITMRLAVPVQAYQGVVLAYDDQADGRLYRICLVHADADLCVELHRAADMPGLLTLWRNWAEFFGRPPLYGEATSQTRPRCHSAPRRPRRRGDIIVKRRPRFLKRRRAGGPLAM